jgi:hypothetical protein
MLDPEWGRKIAEGVQYCSSQLVGLEGWLDPAVLDKQRFGGSERSISTVVLSSRTTSIRDPSIDIAVAMSGAGRRRNTRQRTPPAKNNGSPTTGPIHANQPTGG